MLLLDPRELVKVLGAFAPFRVYHEKNQGSFIMQCVLCGASVTIYLRNKALCADCAVGIVNGDEKPPDTVKVEHSQAASNGVAKTLRTELDSCRQRLKQAQKSFQEAIDQAGHVVLHSDGSQHISNAGREYRAACEAFVKALARSSDFATMGVIPEDLKTSSSGNNLRAATS